MLRVLMPEDTPDMQKLVSSLSELLEQLSECIERFSDLSGFKRKDVANIIGVNQRQLRAEALATEIDRIPMFEPGNARIELVQELVSLIQQGIKDVTDEMKLAIRDRIRKAHVLNWGVGVNQAVIDLIMDIVTIVPGVFDRWTFRILLRKASQAALPELVQFLLNNGARSEQGSLEYLFDALEEITFPNPHATVDDVKNTVRLLAAPMSMRALQEMKETYELTILRNNPELGEAALTEIEIAMTRVNN
jgi:hypothetical protein